MAPPNGTRPHRIGSGAAAAAAPGRQRRCNGTGTGHPKMAEGEWKVVRRVPNKGQDGMANDMVLPRAGALGASWIRNTHHDGSEQSPRFGHCSFY
jgi:hypothetical protein